MPELPEVETVVRTLEYQLGNVGIASCEVLYPNIIDNVEVNVFCELLKNERFTSYSRRGKYLIFTLDTKVLVCHLRMEGKFYVEKNLSLVDKHTHVIFTLDDGRYLLYHDVRKFGRMYLYDKNEPLSCLSKLGLEPWDSELNVEYLRSKAKDMPIKQFLLDQSIIAGIGNIYANEICFALNVLPMCSVSAFTNEMFEQVIVHTRRILENAIASGGTTIRSYTSSLGVDGRFQLSLMVHGRDKEECKICHEKIVKIQLKGRGTYYCPRCQK